MTKYGSRCRKSVVFLDKKECTSYHNSTVAKIMEKLDIFTLDLLGKSFLEWGKSFKKLVEIFTPVKWLDELQHEIIVS